MSVNPTYVYGIAGVILLTIILDTEPKWGGWLLLLTVFGLLLSKRAQTILRA